MADEINLKRKSTFQNTMKHSDTPLTELLAGKCKLEKYKIKMGLLW